LVILVQATPRLESPLAVLVSVVSVVMLLATRALEMVE
jgi:hypothetical protein